MATWTRWLALPLAGLLLVAAGGHTQPPAGPPPDVVLVPPATGTAPVRPVLVDLPLSTTVPQPAPRPAPELTIDQLLDRLERLRQQKEELDRQEKAVTVQLKDALRKQRERIGRLGVDENPPPPPQQSVPSTSSVEPVVLPPVVGGRG